MAVQVDPQRRDAVEVAAPVAVDEPVAVGARDHERLPLAHLRQRVPQVLLVFVDEVHAKKCRSSRSDETSASRCASEWVAISETRSRAVPGGTVGGRMPWA